MTRLYLGNYLSTGRLNKDTNKNDYQQEKGSRQVAQTRGKDKGDSGRQ